MSNIQTILTWPDQAIVESLQAKVKAVYERRSGQGREGVYYVQNIVVADATGEIRVSVWNHDDLEGLQDKTVSLSSAMGRNGKLSGVKVKHGTYKDKPTIVLEVGKQGKIQVLASTGGSISGHSGPISGDSSSGGGQSSPPPAQTPQIASNGHLSHDAKGEGMRAGMCFKLAGDYVLRLMDAGNTYNEDEFVGMVKSLAPKLLAASRELEGK